jgi:hypothetical protein
MNETAERHEITFFFIAIIRLKIVAVIMMCDACVCVCVVT